ncbi:MAG: M28 family peptidase [Gemmatimonadota bacterium]
MNLRYLAPAAVLMIAALAVFALRPSGDPPEGEAVPTATGTDDHAGGAVDVDRLMADLSVLAHDSMQGRAPGTEESEAARRHIIESLQDAGVAPLGEGYERAFTIVDGGNAANVVGVVEGTAPGSIVLTAHYDHVGVRDGTIYNGADDNASGTAAVLEIGRIVAAEPLAHSLVVVLFDAEEVGLQGARAFVSTETVPLADILLNVNLDMVSRSGGTLWAAGAHHTPALRPVLEEVALAAPAELLLGHDQPGVPGQDDWTSASDHGPFHAAGLPFVYFGVEDHPDYHQPTDDVEQVVPSDFHASVQTILSALRALDAALPLEPSP